MPTYPVLRFLDKHGNWLALLFAALPPLLAIWAVCTGYSVLFLALGLALGGAVYLLFKSYVELLRVMIDMLLPK